MTAELTHAAGTRTLTLSHTPSELVRGAAPTGLAPDLVLGGGPDGFAYIVDVTASAGTVFVLDGLAHEVRAFDQDGRELGRFGRRGEGPGEFRSPIAITAAGDRVVTWQSPRDRALAVWNLESGLLTSGGARIDGDWDNGPRRRPSLIGPIDSGPEDRRQRLRAAGRSHFVHELHPDEEPFRRSGEPYPYEVPPAHLVRYDLNLAIVDTIAVLAGARLEIIDEEVPIRGTTRVDVFPIAHERFYASRPVWATGADWIALGHGDSTSIEVRRFDGEPVLDIRWPARRRRIDEDEMRDAAKWMLAYQILHASNAREYFEGLSRREIEEGIDWTIAEMGRFAEKSPMVTSAFGAGECLFVSGFSAEDSRYGVGLAWLVVNVREGSLHGVLRFEPETAMRFGHGGIVDRHGATVTHITERHAFLIAVDGYGESYVERFELPSEYSCASSG